MTHDAFMAEYGACIVELELSQSDVSLAALPLYHSAQMHCFSMPQLLVGATVHLIDAPVPETVLRLIEQHRITSFFAPPTVWISLLRHPDFDTRDLSTLRSVFYGASIMPVPVLQELRQRLPGVRRSTATARARSDRSRPCCVRRSTMRGRRPPDARS